MAIEDFEKAELAQATPATETVEAPSTPSSDRSIGKEHQVVDESSRRPSSTPSTRAQAVLHEVKEQTTAQEGEDEIEYPSGPKLALITAALCLAIFCMALDNTIIATAIPRITDDFKALNDVGWYGSAYLLTTCAFQLLYGSAYKFYSIKYVFLFALLIFEIGSAVCGAAPTSPAFIIGRAIAGLGSAGIFSGGILIIAHSVPLQNRPMYTGMIASMYGIASVAGPLLGGLFTDKLSWRWCFYINLPLGAITMVFIAFFFKAPVQKDPNANLVRTVSGNHTTEMTWQQKLRQFDVLGTVVLIPAVVCLLLALQWGGSTYAWKSWRIILCLVMFAVLAVVFAGIQFWKGETATVPPRILRQRSVAASCWFAACVGAAFFVLIYFVPIWFQAIEGVSAVESGIRNLPMILGLVIVSLLAGAAVTFLGYYTPFCLASTVFMSVGAGLLTTFKTDSGHAMWIGYQFIFGAGVGMGMQQPMIAVQTVLPLRDVPIGTALVMFSQTLGGALFISVAQNVFTNELVKNLRATVPGVSIELVLTTGATTLAERVPPRFLHGVLEAYNKTLTTTWYVSVAMAAVSIFGSALIQWRSVKGKPIGPAVA